MKLLKILLLAMLVFPAFSQTIPQWYNIDGVDVRRNGSTSFSYPADTSVGYFVMNRDTNGLASMCLVLGDSADQYLCFFLGPDTGWVSSSVPTNFSPPSLLFKVTYAQAQVLTGNGDLFPQAWYNITDDSVYIQAVTDSTFGLNGYYADSTIWEIDAIQFDFLNEHIQQRCDKRGNCVGSTFAVASLMGVNPVHVFPWGNDNCLGNTVKDAVFDFTGNLDPSASGNNILFLSEVSITTNEQFWNNTFINSTGSILDTARVSYGNFESSTITVINDAGLLNAVANNGEITLSGEVLAQGLNVTTNSKVIATNSATIVSALLRKSSVLTVSDTVDANGIELWENDTVTLSGTVNAINCRLYTGADILASGAIFIEGMVIQNVSKFYGSGTGSISPSFICNQSIVTVSGNVDMANNYISSSVVGFTDSTRCPNCWFYSVVDTFNGVTLDTFNYSMFNRNSYYLNVDVDTFSLTDGTQGVGKLLISDASGKGTYQKLGSGLPKYATVALAVAGGLVSGDPFILTGLTLGVSVVDVVVLVP